MTRPTNKAELCREAGIFSIRRCDIYVCDSPTPLEDNVQVFLENGMLVRFVPAPAEHTRLERLHARLQDHETWPGTQVLPRVLPASTLMLLHESGRFLFNRAPAPGSSVETAIADFIGVPRHSITLRSPADGCCAHFSYRGSNIRGVLACAPSQGITDGAFVVYLDFRQIASAIQFVLLSSRKLAYDDIHRLLPREPPFGWRLAIQGGRRHRQYLEVWPGETLIFGFIHDSTPAFELDSGSSAQNDSDDGDESDESEEDAESEPPSRASTRSRSRPRGLSERRKSPSTDHSYQGPVPDHTLMMEALWHSKVEWKPSIDLLLSLGQNSLTSAVEDAQLFLSGPPKDYLMSYTGEVITHRVPEATPRQQASAQQHLLQTANPAPRIPGQGERPFAVPVPVFLVDRPGTGQAAQVQAQRYTARFFLFAFEYAPELVDVELQAPASVDEAIALVQAARGERARSRFSTVVPVYPQPVFEYAVAVVVQAWCRDTYVLFDMSKVNGTMFCAHISPAVDLASIVAIAGLDRNAAVEVYVGDLASRVRHDDVVQLQTGLCITIVPVASPPFFVAFLPDMLLSAAGWNANAPLSAAGGKWIHLLTDTVPSRFRLDPERRLLLRQDIAGTIAADVARLTLQPTEPRIPDLFDNGILAHSVLVATTELARPATSAEDRIIYVLDMRPISAGLMWAFAARGMLAVQPIVDRCDAVSPPGYRTRLTGGQVVHTDDGLYLRLRPGAVIWADYVPREIESSSTESSEPDSDGSSSSDDEGPADEAPDACGAQSDGDFGNETTALEPAVASERFRQTASATRTVTGGRVEMWASWFLLGAVLAGNTMFTPFLLPVAVMGFALGSSLSPRSPGPFGFSPYLFFAVICVCWGRAEAVQLHLAPASSRAHESDQCQDFDIDPGPIRATDWRPIPTPCRAPEWRQHDLGEGDAIGPFVTLLEESFQRDGPRACAIAATYLDILCAQYQRVALAVGTCSADRSDSGGVPISLAEAIPPRQLYDLSQVSVKIGRTADDVMPFFNTSWTLSSALPEDLVLHPATRAAINAGACLDKTHCGGLRLYTDGAFNGEYSSWGFAVVLSQPQAIRLLGWARGRVALSGEPGYVGAAAHSALAAEHSALFWASAWILQYHSQFAEGLWSDCLAAAGQARGTHGGCERSPLGRACRAIAQTAEAANRLLSVDYHHVKSHQGEPGNELVDVIAKAHHLPDSSIPWPFCDLPAWVADDTIEWLWLLVEAVRRPTLWPTFQGSFLIDKDLHTSGMPSPAGKFLSLSRDSADVSGTRADGISLRVVLQLVSVNVQTLGENQAQAIPGRVPYVRQQLDLVGANAIGLQETRSRTTSTVVSSTHIRFTSACDPKGCLGVELWFSRTVPWAWQEGRPLYFQNAGFRVLSWAPRHLVARYSYADFRVVFATGHAPTACDPTREAWWTAFASLLINLAGGDKVVLLGDFNARFTEPWAPRVGDLCWETHAALPESLGKLFRDLDLWAPSTFCACHEGLSHTWASPGQGALSRIDFICIPCEWPVCPGASRVLHTTVDFGQVGVDHFAVALSVEVTSAFRGLGRKGSPQIDTHRLTDPDAARVLQHICSLAPMVPWHVDVHTHYDILADYLVKQCAAAFPAQQARQRRVFFTATTWSFRQQRLALRRKVHRLIGRVAHVEKAVCLRAWQAGGLLSRYLLSGVAVSLKCAYELGLLIRELRALNPALRLSIRRDRKAYLAEVANAAATSTTKSIVAKLRPLLGPPKRRCRGEQSVPAIQLENGQLANDTAEAEQRWIRHFAAIEAGEPMPPARIAATCFERQRSQDLADVIVERADLPTRTELERGLRLSPCGRAAGKDAVPGDVLHVAAAQLAPPVFQLLLKLAMRLQEPLQWKGGELHHVWKRKQSALLCDSYRAILVSSTIGKSVHSVFRQRCGDYLDAAATPMQIGGRRGFPVQLAMHAARLFHEAMRRRNAPSALVFLDLSEAFHRVARPLVHGGELCPEHICGIVGALGLSPEVVPRLQTYVTQQSLLIKAGASAWTGQILREFSQDSWFVHGTLEGTAIVRSGTRPGDNLADMVFSFLFAEILHSLRRQFAHAGLRLTLPWQDDWLCAEPQADGVSGNQHDACPVDVTWMDDLALLVTADRAEDLPLKVAAVATATITECVQATLLPNLAQGKTEAVLSLRGPGSKAVRASVFRGSDPSIQLHSTIWPAARLRVVPKYKHVGGIIEANGGLDKELKSRIGGAWAAFRQRKRQVFMSPAVTHREKSILFTSLIESTLYYGVGTWPNVDDHVEDKLQGALVGMARLMLRPTYSIEEARHGTSARTSVLRLRVYFPAVRRYGSRDCATFPPRSAKLMLSCGPSCTTSVAGFC